MIRFEVLGDNELTAALRRMTPALRRELQASIGRLALRLQTVVKGGKLSGQVLNVRTGRLRRSVDQRTTATDQVVEGRVFTNVEYARGHEYGHRGRVGVRGHLRLVKQAFGKRIKQPRHVFVRPHAKQVNLPERSFLRSTLRDMQGLIESEVSQAVDRSMSQ